MRFAMSRLRLLGLLALSVGVPLGASSAVAAEDSAAEPAKAPNPKATKAATEGETVLEAIDRFIEEQAIDRKKDGWKLKLPKPPKLSFDAKKKYVWDLETSQGPIEVHLLPEVAPMHASSTIYLTRLGFYDGLPFHRVIPGFMAQGGDPLGSGRGGPGYKYDGEFDKSVRHDRGGLLSMANSGPGTDGSQFFLTFTKTPWLDGKHTIFGKVVEGKETLKKLEALGSRSGKPSEPVEIRKATIRVE